MKILFLVLVLAVAANAQVQCDSTGDSCPTGDTCCSNGAGGWGCCPAPNATCCSDHIHCCPQEYPVCDVAHQQCKKSAIDFTGKAVPMMNKRDTIKPVTPPKDVQCDSTGDSCPTGDTCCSNGAGGWGCCPAPNATCCSDHIHCCPQEYPVCDVAHQQCKKSAMFGAKAVPMMNKRDTIKPPKPVTPPKDVQCDSTGDSCPTGDTCCSNGAGGWGCCPAPNATCCSDHIHCCPQEYPVCDVAHQQCKKSAMFGAAAVPMMDKKPTKNVFSVDDHAPALDVNIINAVNKAGTTWKAGANKRFMGKSVGHVRGLCGSLEEPESVKLPRKAPSLVRMALPDSFDARTQWGGKCPSLLEVRDQGSCGSCWAVSAVEAMTDRLCIHSNGTKQFHLSSEDMTSCCGFFCGQGCDGGYPSAAWSYWKTTGLVTGGPYNSKQGCFPYEVPACDHHVSGSLPPCGDIVPTPACTKQCEAGYSLSWSADKHFGSSGYSVSGVQQIQQEIYTNGPVQASFTVYADFVSYKSGVYQHTTGAALGGHAVKILGWGTDSGTPYWIVANSWNADWGNHGYFNILRGSDECGIEDGIVAGLPKEN